MPDDQAPSGISRAALSARSAKIRRSLAELSARAAVVRTRSAELCATSTRLRRHTLSLGPARSPDADPAARA